MIAPKSPKNERKRQKAVESYGLLDSKPEEKYDNITSLISKICEAPVALITMLDNDRNFLKSHHGLPFNESPRKISFCGHAINSNDSIMIVEDARNDERFHDNPLVKDFNAIFYAGVPLTNINGYKLGTICVYDHKPRVLTLEQKEALKIMAKQVVMLFEQRIQNDELLLLKENLQLKNSNLEKFASVVSHDLKSPVNNIISLVELLKNENPNLSKDSLLYIDYLKESSESLKKYIDGVLSFYKSDELFGYEKKSIILKNLIKNCKQIVDINKNATINLESKIITLYTNETALEQILVNLLTNSIKYNDKEHIIIDINCFEDEDFYYFKVSDNGRGIKEENLEKIFNLFEKSADKDRYGESGNGIGLATVQKIVSNLGGEIKVSSVYNKKTVFDFTLEKD